jgi:aminoglycoside phosphotransferase (APT) family kinase protein
MAAELPQADLKQMPEEIRARIPGCEDGRLPLAAWVLPGGGRNDVWRIDTAQGRFVWRRRRAPVDRPGSAAATELLAQRCAAEAGLAPTVIAAHPEGHWMLMPFVEATVWTASDLHNPSQVARLGEQLARLHSLPVPQAIPVVDPAGIARGYLLQLWPGDAATARALGPCVDEVAALTAELETSGTHPVLVHGDLVLGNLLGKLPLMIDWEYAQNADATWDLACLLSYHPQAQLLEPLMCALAVDDPAARERLRLQQRIFAKLNHLWSLVHLPGAE